MTAEPQRPDLARELLIRAHDAATRRAQRIRKELAAVQLGQIRHADYANARVLRRILMDYDWPGHRLVGPDAARAAWSIALHSDDEPDVQRAATILLRRAVEAGDALIQHWAHLHDRVKINSGQDQEYGTQFLLRVGGVELCPLRAPESLDERRASVGLSPIAVALETVRRRYTREHRTEDTLTLTLAEAA